MHVHKVILRHWFSHLAKYIQSSIELITTMKTAGKVIILHMYTNSGDMGLETLRGRRDRAKLKWWYKLVSMPKDRYPKQLFSREWETKPRRGRQRKVWGRVVDELFVSLGLDKHEWVEDIKRGESSLASFLACINESISESQGKQFEEGLNSKEGSRI